MDLPQEIRDELDRARCAEEEGNDGKARVCARRAVGKAFFISQYSSGMSKYLSTTQCLRMIHEDEGMPDPVRDAAVRLSMGVAEKQGSGISTRPVEDAFAIISRLLDEQKQSGK